jgi:hypothetical protein
MIVVGAAEAGISTLGISMTFKSSSGMTIPKMDFLSTTIGYICIVRNSYTDPGLQA